MRQYILILVIAVAALTSCGDGATLSRLESIKRVSSSDPELAARMLDSLDLTVRGQSESVRMRYAVLRLRLDDMTGVMPVSDLHAKAIVDYYEKVGNGRDRQEAHFMAGCVYRDLHDTPRAIEHFFKAVGAASDTRHPDSVLLRQTYSCLHTLYYNVHDYRAALAMARQETALAQRHGIATDGALMHLGCSWLALDSSRQARKCFGEVLRRMRLSRAKPDSTILYALLRDYTSMADRAGADGCYRIVERTLRADSASVPDYNALGAYFAMTGRTEWAANCYRKVIDGLGGNRAACEAAKALARLYYKGGDMALSAFYADRFANLSDSLDLGFQRQLAASVGNEYQYHLDRTRMEKTERAKRLYLRMAVVVSIFVLVLSGGFYVFYVHRRAAALRRYLRMAEELRSVRQQRKAMQGEIDSKSKRLEAARADLERSTVELDGLNAELDRHSAELEAAKRLLDEKMRQSQSLLQILHQTELKTSAEDVVLAAKEAAKGKRKLTAEEWTQLYRAVDDLHPQFRERLVKRLGSFSEPQMKVCYLMRIGFRNPQIYNVTDIPRTTVWRWGNAFSWVYDEE